MIHRIDAISFHDGQVDCSCGALISEADDPAGDRNAGLVSAWNEHRRANGVPVRSLFDTTGQNFGPKKWSLRSEAITRAMR